VGRRRGCVGRRGCDEEAARLRQAARGGTARLRGGGAARLLGSLACRRGGPPLHPGVRRPRVLTSSPTRRFSTAPSHHPISTTTAPPLSIAATALRRSALNLVHFVESMNANVSCSPPVCENAYRKCHSRSSPISPVVRIRTMEVEPWFVCPSLFLLSRQTLGL